MLTFPELYSLVVDVALVLGVAIVGATLLVLYREPDEPVAHEDHGARYLHLAGLATRAAVIERAIEASVPTDLRQVGIGRAQTLFRGLCECHNLPALSEAAADAAIRVAHAGFATDFPSSPEPPPAPDPKA
ncbi:MAG: hypothetical protein Q7R41_08190 [Phycisphaerales bacterium]|nr:hypothetical protein [Phycisphaerales bacterium]